jgi:hypothetical protein
VGSEYGYTYSDGSRAEPGGSSSSGFVITEGANQRLNTSQAFSALGSTAWGSGVGADRPAPGFTLSDVPFGTRSPTERGMDLRDWNAGQISTPEYYWRSLGLPPGYGDAAAVAAAVGGAWLAWRRRWLGG